MTMDTPAAGRDPNGRFTREPDTVARDAEALRLRARGKTYPEIAEAMGYGDKSAARKAVERGLTETVQEAADEVRQLELARLDEMTVRAYEVLGRKHVTVSHGRVVRQEVGVERDADGTVVLDGDGKPIPIYEDLLDDAPVLAAIDRLIAISARRCKLLGLDAPVKAEIGGELTYHIVGIDVSQL